jgi:hypothetical protein
MRRVKLITAAAVLSVLTLLSGSAAAQETNTQERTFLTFSNTFELPGLTLQPGTYVFKLADTPSRNVVQVWNRDEKEMLGHWTFVQAERNRVTEDNVVMFKEMPAGTTPAVQYWYFPGERIGKEFIYPKDQAARIAKATGSKVLTGEGESASVSSINAQGEVTEWKREETTTAAAAPQADTNPVQSQVQLPADTRAEAPAQESTQASAQESRAQAPAPAASEPSPVGTSGREAQVARADTLPQTSSPLVLSGLLGLLSLAGAAGVRAFRK